MFIHLNEYNKRIELDKSYTHVSLSDCYGTIKDCIFTRSNSTISLGFWNGDDISTEDIVLYDEPEFTHY